MQIKCHKVCRGTAEGPALVSKDAISFLGGVDPKTGNMIEKGHALYGKNVKGTILIFPGGKGSTVGSYVIYQLKKNGVAPAAMINLRAEPIVAVGAIISDIPMVDMPEQNPIEAFKDGQILRVNATDGTIEVL